MESQDTRKPSEILQAAYDELTPGNWGRYKMFSVKSDGTKCMCVHGAVCKQVEPGIEQRSFSERVSSNETLQMAAEATYMIICGATPAAVYEDNRYVNKNMVPHLVMGMVGLTAGFNDNLTNHFADVQAKLRSAIALAKQLESLP